MFVDRGIESLFAQSYSKNLGLYAGAKHCALPLDSRPLKTVLPSCVDPMSTRWQESPT